ncbi:hypothetical protein ACN4EK_15040 [Pantanalinema rosaneae CENA516]|uniref:hypothetical protein n=1 Tax=Pantanalinema rosaneae TaxID=1620701 RepID=UPI003D6FD673
MLKNKIRRRLWQWFRTSLLTFIVIISVTLLLVLFLLIFQVPSFEIGGAGIWLIRWYNPPRVPFSIAWNLLPLLAIAAISGLIRVLLSVKPFLSQDKS